MADAAPAAPAGPTDAPDTGDASAPAQGGAAGTGGRGPDGKFTKAPGAPATPAEVRKFKLRLKDDGPEEEYDETWLRTHVQKGLGAAQLQSKAENARREAAKLRADAEAKLARFKDKPWEVLKEFGHDPSALAKKQLLEQMEEESLTPEQRRIRELEGKTKEYEAEKAKAQEAKAKADFDAETERHKEEFSTLFLDTLKASGLPLKSARAAFGRMAALYQSNEANGEKSTPEEMAAHVVEGLREEHRALVGGMTVQEKIAWLGPDFLLELRRHDIAQLRQKVGGSAPAPQQRQSQPAQPTKLDPRKGRWATVEEYLK